MRMCARGLVFTVVVLLFALSLTPPTALADEPNDCPNVDGTSSEDRIGCPDADGDGWSDADENWTVGDGADAFPKTPSQWVDRDRDGYGDNGAFDAELIDHFPDDENLHRAVVSVGCNPPDHTIAKGKSSYFTCTIKNEGANRLRVLIEWEVGKGIEAKQLPDEVILEPRGIADDQSEIRLSFDATITGLSGGDLILNESSDDSPIYSIRLGVLVEDVKPTTVVEKPNPSLDPVMRQASDVAEWMSDKSGRNISVQAALAIIVIIPFCLFVIARRTQGVILERREHRESLEEEPANEDGREEELTEEVSIEDMADDPNQETKGPKRGVKGAEGKVLSHDMVEVIVGEFDMPNTPSDSFEVLSESIDDSDIEGEGWGNALSELSEDEKEQKVSSKHRAKTSHVDAEEVETKTARKKGRGADKKIGKKAEKPDHSPEEEPPKKKGKKKRPKGKVGHTRGPGVDL